MHGFFTKRNAGGCWLDWWGWGLVAELGKKKGQPETCFFDFYLTLILPFSKNYRKDLVIKSQIHSHPDLYFKSFD